MRQGDILQERWKVGKGKKHGLIQANKSLNEWKTGKGKGAAKGRHSFIIK